MLAQGLVHVVVAAALACVGPAEPAATAMPASQQAPEGPSPELDPVASAPPTATYAPGRAQDALARAQQAADVGRLEEALTELAYVLAAEPESSAAYRLRAQVYARLAVAYSPSAAFLRAEAQDLAYVVELEPDATDRVELERRITALYGQAGEAAQREARRRKLRSPALVLTALGIAGIAAGSLLIGITPSDKPTAPGHRDNDIGGVVALSTGVALAITAAVLGGLAARQTRRDAAVTRYYELAGRPRVQWAIGPTSVGLRF